MCSRGPEGSGESPNTQVTGTLLACRRSRSATQKLFQILTVRSAEQTSADLSKLSSGASALPLPESTICTLTASSSEDFLKDSPGSPVLPQSSRTVLAAIVALELRAGPVRLRENRSPAAFRRRASPHPPAAPGPPV